MRKLKIGIYCYLMVDILTKVLQKCSLSSPLPNIFSFVLICEFDWLPGCHGNGKARFAKQIFKNHPLRRGIKLKHCRNVHNISLYKNCFHELSFFGNFGKIAVYFFWLSLSGDCRVTDEALLVETT